LVEAGRQARDWPIRWRLFGALGNLWATRGRHPGWMLMAAALILIVFGVTKSSG
jgi:hypothetical protein